MPTEWKPAKELEALIREEAPDLRSVDLSVRRDPTGWKVVAETVKLQRWAEEVTAALRPHCGLKIPVEEIIAEARLLLRRKNVDATITLRELRHEHKKWRHILETAAGGGKTLEQLNDVMLVLSRTYRFINWTGAATVLGNREITFGVRY